MSAIFKNIIAEAEGLPEDIQRNLELQWRCALQTEKLKAEAITSPTTYSGHSSIPQQDVADELNAMLKDRYGV